MQKNARFYSQIGGLGSHMRLEHLTKVVAMKGIDFLKCLPSGSGWDQQWHLEKEFKNGNVILGTKFHPMNSYGCYLSWIPVNVYINITRPYGFTVTFHRDRRMGTHGVLNHLIESMVDDIHQSITYSLNAYVRKYAKKELESVHANMADTDIYMAIRSKIRAEFARDDRILNIIKEEVLFKISVWRNNECC